jgi:hypothetical protein
MHLSDFFEIFLFPAIVFVAILMKVRQGKKRLLGELQQSAESF